MAKYQEFGGVGIPAEGTIVRVGSPELVDHDWEYSFNLQFRTEDGQEVTTIVYRHMSKFVAEDIQVHTPVPMSWRYNPVNPEQVRIGWGSAIRHGRSLPGPQSQSASPADPNDPYVPKQGIIMAVSPTGEIVSGQGEMNLRVQVTRPDGTRSRYEKGFLRKPASYPVSESG